MTFWGVIECFTETVVTPDTDLLDTMSTVGQHVGQFIARTRVETDMRDEQRRTQAILDTALDAIVGMDHRGVITAFNPAAERLFGYSRSQALGRDLSDLLIPPVLRQQHRDGLARYLATGHGPFIDRRVETRGYRADGHEFPVEVAITRVSDDPPTFTGFVRDLTSRVHAQQEREALLQRELSASRCRSATAPRTILSTSSRLRTTLNAIWLDAHAAGRTWTLQQQKHYRSDRTPPAAQLYPTFWMYPASSPAACVWICRPVESRP